MLVAQVGAGRRSAGVSGRNHVCAAAVGVVVGGVAVNVFGSAAVVGSVTVVGSAATPG